MNMVWHYHGTVEIESGAVSPDTGFKGDRAGGRWQGPTLVSGERQEDGFVGTLVVREMAAVFVNSLPVTRIP